MFKNIFSFEGRIRRSEHNFTLLIYLVLVQIIEFLMESLNMPLLAILIFPLLYILIAQSAKRCHDLGNSGWYQLIPFYVLVLIFSDSKFGPNKYGDNPKGEGNGAEINQIGTE